MRFQLLAVLASACIAMLVAPADAAGRLGSLAVCMKDYRALCSEIPLGGGRVAACLQQHRDALSPDCRSAIEGRTSAQATAAEGGARTLSDVAYGKDPAQRLDVYIPRGARNAPVIVMMHGGAWVIGSKRSRGVVEAKVAHWLPRGYIFVSVETRLLPAADPIEQAGDLAAALAFVQQNAAKWGGDASRLVLMGHSAGAHLVAMLTADPTIAGKRGLKTWTASIALDSAAYDVARIMNARHARLYDRAFGNDPAFWRRASPTLQMKGKPAPALLVCSSKRRESCDQAAAFAASLKRAGGRADMLPEDLTHMQINGELGKVGAYTSAVDRFLKSLGLP